MEIGILGPLTLQEEEVSGMLTALKPRKVLALLLLYANQVVPTTALMEELWDDEPPLSALTTLQTYILQLRKLLSRVLRVKASEIAREILVTKTCGYMLRVQPGTLDLHQFECRAEEGHKALAVGENDRAARLLREALEIWRGPALVDVKAGRLLEMHVMRLEQSRLSALEQRIEADLRLGWHHELLSELTALVARYPLHENPRAQLMLALYRSGRRPCALEVFQRLRHVLIEELGVEPSAKMQRLQQAILSSDPALDTPPPGGCGLLLDRFAHL